MEPFANKLDDHTIQFVRIMPGPIEKIWDYLADSKKRGQWFAKGPMPITPGENFEMTFKHSDMSPHKAPPPEKMKEMDANGHVSINTLLAFEPPHRLGFSFGKDSQVDIRLTEEGDNVRLTLTHSKIPDRAFALNISGGWHAHLAVLQYRAEGKVPPPFWDVWRETENVYDKRYG